MKSLLQTWAGSAAMLLGGVLAVSAVDTGQGFDEATVGKWLQANSKFQRPAVAPEQEAALEVAKPVAEFRKAAAEDPKLAFAKYAANKSAVGFLALSEVYEKAPGAWSCFFRGSMIIMTHLKSEVVRTAFYNPFIDAMVVLDWDRPAGRIIRGALCTTTTFLNLGKPSLRPQWVGMNGQFDLTLRHYCKDVIAEFEKQNPPLSATRPVPFAVADPKPEVQVVEGRLTAMEATIRKWLAPESAESLINPLAALLGAISKKDESQLRRLLPADNPVSPSGIASLPERICGSMHPVFFLADGSTVLVFLEAQEATSFFATAYYDQRSKRLKGLTFLTVVPNEERFAERKSNENRVNR